VLVGDMRLLHARLPRPEQEGTESRRFDRYVVVACLVDLLPCYEKQTLLWRQFGYRVSRSFTSIFLAALWLDSLKTRSMSEKVPNRRLRNPEPHTVSWRIDTPSLTKTLAILVQFARVEHYIKKPEIVVSRSSLRVKSP
jgi:hypothetical protein